MSEKDIPTLELQVQAAKQAYFNNDDNASLEKEWKKLKKRLKKVKNTFTSSSTTLTSTATTSPTTKIHATSAPYISRSKSHPHTNSDFYNK